jgi:predicted RNase H-like HicB family nuclease
MSLPYLQSDSPADIEVTLVLAKQVSGKVTASVMEFPNCHVEAETRETAIADLKILLAQRLQNIEMVPVKISLSTTSSKLNAWSGLFGILKESQYFDEVMSIIQEEREKLGNEEIDPAFYMPLKFSSENSENSWPSLCGILKDDENFVEWSDRFWAEKQQNIDNDEVLSVEESLNVT